MKLKQQSKVGIALLGIYPKDCDTGYSRGTYTSMFIVAVFTIAKLWKQPRCPNTEEWIKKMWYLSSATPPTTGVGEDAREKGTLLHCWWECKLVQPLWKKI
jgi:hypothetical protein